MNRERIIGALRDYHKYTMDAEEAIDEIESAIHDETFSIVDIINWFESPFVS